MKMPKRLLLIGAFLCAGGLAGWFYTRLPAHANLVLAPTSSSSGPVALGWNSLHYNSACSALSGTNNTIATGSGGGTDCVVYAVNGQTTGRYYGEIDVSGTITGETQVGLGNTLSPTTPTNGFLGGDASTVGLDGGHSVFNQNASIGTGAFFATGNSVCTAIDLTNSPPKVWFANVTTGNGWEEGGTDSPATGTGGIQLNLTGNTLTTNPVVFAGNAPPLSVLTIVGNLPCLADTVHGYGSAYLAGFSPFPGSTNTLTAETWNPSRVGGTFPNTFSGGNLTVTAGSGLNALRASYGTPGFLSGKYYWQVTVTYASTAINAGGLGVGNGAASAANTQYTGVDNNSIGYYGDGEVFLNALTLTTIAAYSSTTAVCVAVDYANHHIWFQPIGTGQWNNAAIGSQSPAGNVGGLDISAITASGTVAISPATTLNNAGDTAVANFSSTPCSGVTGLTGFTTIP